MPRRRASEFEGLAALVTGGTAGIGAAIADALEAEGCRVLRHGLADGDLVADLSQAGSGEALGLRALAAGPVDILVHSASVQLSAEWRATSPAELELQYRVNVSEPFGLVRSLLPGMIDRGWGRILAIGSVQQSRPHPRMIGYAASKAAQFSIVRNLASQVAGRGVTVNSLSPGVVETDRNREALADAHYRRSLLDAIPAGRLGEPGECAAAALLLCSRRSGYVTGQDLVVDGGLTL